MRRRSKKKKEDQLAEILGANSYCAYYLLFLSDYHCNLRAFLCSFHSLYIHRLYCVCNYYLSLECIFQRKNNKKLRLLKIVLTFDSDAFNLLLHWKWWWWWEAFMLCHPLKQRITERKKIKDERNYWFSSYFISGSFELEDLMRLLFMLTDNYLN